MKVLLRPFERAERVALAQFALCGAANVVEKGVALEVCVEDLAGSRVDDETWIASRCILDEVVKRFACDAVADAIKKTFDVALRNGQRLGLVSCERRQDCCEGIVRTWGRLVVASTAKR